MKITAFISRVAAQYMASDALVLPVEAQAARLAPIDRACVKAADIPLSLNEPDGFSPSYCKYNRPALSPTNCPTASACCNSVSPSPTVTTESGVANGNNS